jgi:thiol:disulfide interchange protein
VLSPDALKFDVVVDESPASPNAKERNWALMSPLLQTILQMPDLPAEAKLELFKGSPIPAGIMENIERIITEAAPAQQAAQQEQQAMMKEAQQAKTQRDVSAAGLDDAKAAQAHASTGIDVARAEVEMIEGPQQIADEHEKTQFERDQAQADRADTRMQASERNELERSKIGAKANGANGSGIVAPPMLPQAPPQPAAPQQPPQNAAALQQLMGAIQQMTQVSAAMVESAQRPRRYVRDENGMLIGSEVT